MIKFILDSPTAKTFHVEVDGKRVGSPRLGYAPIYLLEPQLPLEVLQDGVAVDMDPECLKNPLAYELALHATYLQVMYYFWPRHSPRSPLRTGPRPVDFNQTLHGLRSMLLARSMRHVYALKDAAKGSAIILATPGPSLDPAYVAANQDRALVIAVGRAITTLVQAGIVPDICWIQDTFPFSWSRILDELAPDALLESILVVNPAGPVLDYADRFQAVYKAWNSQPYETDSFPKLEEIPPSSSTGGYTLARLLGGDPVIVQGCDCGTPLAPEQAEGLDEYSANVSDPGLFEIVDVFTDYKRDILLRYGQDLSVRTQSSYLACAQWYKSRAFRDKMEHGLDLYSDSATGMLRFNSVIRPVGEAPELPASKSLAEPATQAGPVADPKPFARELLKRFNTVDKYLQPGMPLPGVSLRPPFNCIFDHVQEFNGERLVLGEGDFTQARDKLEAILSALDATLNQTS